MRILAIVPCYNEAASVGGVLCEIQSLGYDTLVIDDGSADDTCRIARESSRCVRLHQNLGIGGAMQTGIRFAARQSYDFCVQVDGDGQHPADQIPLLLEEQRRSGANIVIGSRYLLQENFHSTRARRIGGKLIARVLGGGLTDPTSGFRLMNGAAIALFAEHYPHDFPEPISLAWARGRGLSIREAPVRMRPRHHGRSSIMGIATLSYMVRVIFYIMLARIQKRPPY